VIEGNAAIDKRPLSTHVLLLLLLLLLWIQLRARLLSTC
jgi:hypothetical protein